MPMVLRRMRVRSASGSREAATPSIWIAPLVGASSRPAICSSEDFPAPLWPTSATISPARRERSSPLNTSSWPSPSLYFRVMVSSRRTSLIPQRLDRIEPRRPPGWIERGKEGQHQRHHHYRCHFARIHLRRHAGEKIDGGIEQGRAGELGKGLAQALDIGAEQNPGGKTKKKTKNTKTNAGDEEDTHHRAPRRPH